MKFILFSPWALTGVIHHAEKVKQEGILEKNIAYFIPHEQIKTSPNAHTQFRIQYNVREQCSRVNWSFRATPQIIRPVPYKLSINKNCNEEYEKPVSSPASIQQRKNFQI